ncbi:MAG: hypothetical protein ACON5A_02335 [Candidatus Comchoanobacterales bacterium]
MIKHILMLFFSAVTMQAGFAEQEGECTKVLSTDLDSRIIYWEDTLGEDHDTNVDSFKDIHHGLKSFKFLISLEDPLCINKKDSKGMIGLDYNDRYQVAGCMNIIKKAYDIAVNNNLEYLQSLRRHHDEIRVMINYDENTRQMKASSIPVDEMRRLKDFCEISIQLHYCQLLKSKDQSDDQKKEMKKTYPNIEFICKDYQS